VTPLITDLLRRRARSQGADPLITYYDLDTDERTELSATSFLNWVDKTSNLLVDELLLDAGAVIDLELARSHPGHWMTLVLEAAAWQVGAVVRVATAGPSDLLVLGPDWESHDRDGAEAVLACSLHPLGLGFPAALPSDVMDFSLEVRGQGDHHSPAARSSEELAWVDDERELTQGELVSGATGQGSLRRLVRVVDPWSSVRDGLLMPVATGGSAVLVRGDDPQRLDRLIVSERIAAP
jgi:uncharacterized protein (TIGR03089 family)